jgi:hypothetical protein
MARTYGDIRARFQLAMDRSLNEAARSIEGTLLPAMQKILGNGRINVKGGGKDLRFDLGGDSKAALKAITNALNKVGASKFDIVTAGPGEYANGANSGKFTTFIVTFGEDVKDLKVSIGDVIKFVDNNPPRGSIKSKELTPTSLNLPQDIDMNFSALSSSVKGAINGKFSSNLFMQSFLTELYDLISMHKPTNFFNDPLALSAFSETINYDENTREAINALGVTDLNTIGKDFGEVLGAVLLLNMVKTQHGITFPSGNNPLVDFYIDGYGISSKYKSGAAPTLSNIIKNLKSENFTEKSEVQLYDLFKIIESNSVADGYIKGAEFMNTPTVSVLKGLVGNTSLDEKSLESFIQNKMNELGKEEFFTTFVQPLVKSSGRGVDKFDKVQWDKLDKGKKYIGLFSYSLSLELIDVLNGKLGAGDVYINTLRTIVGKLDVKQLYMDLDLKRDQIYFYLKGFSDANAKLSFEAPNVSTTNPSNGKLGFKMK